MTTPNASALHAIFSKPLLPNSLFNNLKTRYPNAIHFKIK